MLALQTTPRRPRAPARPVLARVAAPRPLARAAKNDACGCGCGGGCCDAHKLDGVLRRAVAQRAAHKNHASAVRDEVSSAGLLAVQSDGLRAPHWADARLQAAARNKPPLVSGSRGVSVSKLQAALVSAGFQMPGSTRPDGTMDGIWGGETHTAVRGFQNREGVGADGQAGRKTLTRMDELLLLAPPGPAPAPTCPAGNAATKKTGCIQPIVIANDDGSKPTKAPSMDQAVAIWAKCCVDYTVKPTQTVKKTAYRTLDESPTDTPTAEEVQLFADAGASECIQVFVPVQFAQGTKKGKQISGGGGTYDGGGANPKIVVVEGAKPEVVAHEVGHASGHGDHDTAATVMKPTGAHDKANKRAVSLGVCGAARTGPCLKDAVDDCCQNPT
ncbi:MAG TPA: peptidoglycan-binding domain-containing protein [Solirubrobacteraceae bacterium]|nr:peptidoglycan-binding domain-containing protein [Solirubrobacteraceae bacterium]